MSEITRYKIRMYQEDGVIILDEMETSELDVLKYCKDILKTDETDVMAISVFIPQDVDDILVRDKIFAFMTSSRIIQFKYIEDMGANAELYMTWQSNTIGVIFDKFRKQEK